MGSSRFAWRLVLIKGYEQMTIQDVLDGLQSPWSTVFGIVPPVAGWQGGRAPATM